MKPQVILDIECYSNYFLAMFYNPVTERFVWFERTEEQSLPVETILTIIDSVELITFNGIGYDIPVLSEALRGAACEDLKALSDTIIRGDIKPWHINSIGCDHIDLIEVAFGQASLKIYGGRLACQRLQDLPIEPDAILTREQMDILREYCKNDLRTTATLLKTLTPQINLRRGMSAEYGVDLRSKSDAQIAESVIGKELERITGTYPKKIRLRTDRFLYEKPDFLIGFPADVEAAIAEPFRIKANGGIEMSPVLAEMIVPVGGSRYQMGIGGLHSMEKRSRHVAGENILAEFDVTSYYPSIILRCGLYPPHLGEEFLTVYRRLVDERVEAKKVKDSVKADSLKVTINGSFGKLGSPYSILYSPQLLIQVTLTGQLSLLMLILWMEKVGISVVSANTDGLVCSCPRDKESLMLRVIALWEERTGFNMERTDYASLHSRDVNNYVGIKTDGKVKTKGCFAFSGLSKNPQNEVCSRAVIEFLKNGIPVEETVRNCTDITKFLTVRTVRGGAVKAGIPLGKAIRWYYANGVDGTINYKTNGNKVPRSDGAKPLMNLPDEFPDDVNYSWYIQEAKSLIKDLGGNV